MPPNPFARLFNEFDAKDEEDLHQKLAEEARGIEHNGKFYEWDEVSWKDGDPDFEGDG